MNRRRLESSTAVVMALVLIVGPAAYAQEQPECDLGPADRALLASALSGWRAEAKQVLQEDDPVLPWIILVGNACEWHVAPALKATDGFSAVETALSWDEEPVPLWSKPHGGSVSLPSGQTVPIQPSASTQLSSDGQPFVLLSLPEVWRQHPAFVDAERTRIDEFWLGVFLHEVVHTRQLPWVAKRLEALQDAGRLPEDLDDNFIQNRFGETPAFVEAVQAELKLLHRAASSPDPDTSRRALREALGVAENRRQRHFSGDARPYAEVEALFLALEGAAVWAAFRQAIGEAALEERLADYDPFARDWVQAYGLLAYAVIARYVPDWAERSFGGPPESPFVLLGEAANRNRAE